MKQTYSIKSLLVVFFAAIATAVSAQTAVFDFASNPWNLPVSSSTAADAGNITAPIVQGDITLSVETKSKTATRLWSGTGGAITFRIYQPSTMTLTAPAGKNIRTITADTYANLTTDVTVSSGTTTQKGWTGDANAVTFTFTKNSTFTSITVTYADAGSTPTPQPEPQPLPTLTYNTDLYEALNVAAPVEGQYVIAFADTTTYRIMKNDTLTKPYYIAAEAYDLTSATAPSAQFLFTIKAKGSGYTIETPESGRFLDLIEVTSGTKTYKNLTLFADGTNTWTFTAGADGTVSATTAVGGTSVLTGSQQYDNFSAAVPGSNAKIVLPVFLRVKTTTAIKATVATASAASADVYTLDGRKAGTSLEGLPKGIYIVGGKKVAVK